MKRKTLSSFIPPLYSDARTGQIVATEAKEPTGQNKEQMKKRKLFRNNTIVCLANQGYFYCRRQWVYQNGKRYSAMYLTPISCMMAKKLTKKRNNPK